MSTFTGTGGDDHLSGTDFADTINGLAGNDDLWGGGGTDTLNGGAGNDILEDSVGHDTLNGGGGIDTLSISLLGSFTSYVYVFAPVGGVVHTPLGSIATSVEQISITGGDGNDVFTGGKGADFLSGWNGNDTLNGGGGGDLLTGSNGADVLNGGPGDDTLVGGGNDDVMRGGAGNDTLVGGKTFDVYSGADLMEGGAGADTFQLAASQRDTLTFVHSSQGVDVNLHTGLGHGGEAEGDIYQTNAFEYVIVQGSHHNDVITGGQEQIGDAGDDRLVALSDIVSMTGGTGADTFAVNFDNHILNNTPRITDFNPGQGDRIDLSAIDAKTGGGDNAFTWIGTADFHGIAGEARYEVQGSQTVIQLQTDKDAPVDFSIVLDGVFALQASEFVL